MHPCKGPARVGNAALRVYAAGHGNGHALVVVACNRFAHGFERLEHGVLVARYRRHLALLLHNAALGHDGVLNKRATDVQNQVSLAHACLPCRNGAPQHI